MALSKEGEGELANTKPSVHEIHSCRGKIFSSSLLVFSGLLVLTHCNLLTMRWTCAEREVERHAHTFHIKGNVESHPSLYTIQYDTILTCLSLRATERANISRKDKHTHAELKDELNE